MENGDVHIIRDRGTIVFSYQNVGTPQEPLQLHAHSIAGGRAAHDRVPGRMVLLQVLERASLFSNGLPAAMARQYCPAHASLSVTLPP